MENLNKETLINNYKKVIKSYPTSDISKIKYAYSAAHTICSLFSDQTEKEVVGELLNTSVKVRGKRKR